MASFPLWSLLYILLLITVFTQPTFSNCETQQLIDEICRQCEDYGFCNLTFNENLKSPRTNLEGLAQITIEQSLVNATNTYIYVNRLLVNTSDPIARDYLTVCDNSYYAVMDSFREAFKSFDWKDYWGMMTYEWEARRAAARCDGVSSEDFFGIINPLVDRNKQMRMLITMAIVTGFMLVT